MRNGCTSGTERPNGPLNQRDYQLYATGIAMEKRVFVKFVSEPKNDPMKTIVGVACAAQAIDDGHDVSVFFAASGTRLLDPAYIEELDQEMGAGSTLVAGMMERIIASATLYCSFASVKAVLGHSEGDGALIVADDKITWSGPPGVIALATNSDVQLTY
jgi:predicted peroxiredoxin